jgi:dipeptidyl aminopeptidase/acylaminoacyl peptidase
MVMLDGDDVYWLEGRPLEGGRNVLVVRRADAAIADVTPTGVNVRSRVHEYGGGDYAVRDGVVYFSDFADQRVYRQAPGDAPRALSPPGARRFADYAIAHDGRFVVAVCEDKRGLEGPEDMASIVALDASSGAETVLAKGRDFYSSPVLSPDGRRIAYLAWDHPDMPWDAAELWLGELSGESVRIAGGSRESVFQPSFGPDGALYFASDRTGYYNLYRLVDGTVQALCPSEAEVGTAQWVFGMSLYAFPGDGSVVCAMTENGAYRLVRIDLATLRQSPIDVPFTSMSSVRAARNKVAMVAGSFTQASAVVALDPASGLCEVLRRSTDLAIPPEYLSEPEAIEFVGADGSLAHAFFYRPKNGGFAAPRVDKPPLIVKVHGGPTGAASSVLSLGAVQFWTSRGFAVVDVNYGGSTGFGRAYRERLRGRWGIVDVEDCAAAARFLVGRGDVDPGRLVISGGSAGGYTVLATLAFRDVFHAGASHYGIGDLELCARESRTTSPHKFESRYLDGLVAPYPERVDVYRQRSPIHAAPRMKRPVVFFQGLDDRVVPPSQAEAMALSLRTRGVYVEYLAFEGEGHGFRRAETIQRVLEAELSFYAKVLGLPVVDETPAGAE